ncbi:MAG TPA: DUF1573 domain-containing protein [Cytophagaceae bacterium]|jgi:hypothetical protein
MKKITLVITLIISAFCVQAQIAPSGSSPDAMYSNAPSFKWDKTSHEFGKITKDKPVTAVFKFTNSGTAPLIITKAEASCGCTVPEYPKEPIAPGQTGIIKATYNAANPGAFTKDVTIVSNVEGVPVRLQIKGEVAAAGTETTTTTTTTTNAAKKPSPVKKSTTAAKTTKSSTAKAKAATTK